MSKMSLFPEFKNSLSPEDFQIIMDELELTGGTLAARLDVDRKTVSRWLNGVVPIPASVALLMKVAHGMLKYSHVWNGRGIADDIPTRRVT